MPNMEYEFGRLKSDVSSLHLPPNVAAAMQNIDIAVPGEATKRGGYQRTLQVDFAGKVSMARKFTDNDGTEVYIVIGPDGAYRET